MITKKRENSCLNFLRRNLLKSKRSQIAIFVILALIIVVSISLILILTQKPDLGIKSGEDPQIFIEKCIEPILEESEELIINHGGYVTPPEPNMEWKSAEIPYLCYVEEQEEICINNEPMLRARAEQEIYNNIIGEVEGCFDSLANKFSNDYNAGATNLNVEIKPDKILVKINKKITINQEGNTQIFEVFNIGVNSPLYNFIKLTNEIINQEVSCDCGVETCNAEIINLAKQNRNFELERFVTGRNEKVYTLREVLTEKEFVFAIRNCVRLGR